jgi:hypothetical protein
MLLINAGARNGWVGYLYVYQIYEIYPVPGCLKVFFLLMARPTYIFEEIAQLGTDNQSLKSARQK